MGGRAAGRLAVAVLSGGVAWFMTLVVVAAAAINASEDLGHRMNVLGRSSPYWPRWEPWWGWYAMHGGAVVIGLAVAVFQWRAGRTRQAEPGAAADAAPKAGRRC